MRALAKLVSVNNPDKILFVGEALVGNEAVDQLSKFDRALRDFSGAGGVTKSRGIDGMLVTKWDTVDDKVRVSPVRHTIRTLNEGPGCFRLGQPYL
jgi:signal recognition particle receptor subunit alpha